MERTSFHSGKLAPLFLLLVMCGRAAAPPSAESAYRDAQAAFARGEADKVVSIASSALQQLGDRDDELVWRLRIVCANGFILQRNGDAARAVLKRPLPPKFAGSEIEVLRLRGLAMAARRLGETDAANALIRQTYVLAQKHPHTLPGVLLVLATFDKAKSDEWSREALRLAREYGDVQTESRVLGTMALQLANQERFDEAIAKWEPGLARARTLGNQQIIEAYEGNLGWAYMELGDYETASALLTRARATAARIGARNDLLPWTYQLGNIRFQDGDLAGAETLYLAALDLAVKTKHEQKPIILAYLANAALKGGRVGDAKRYADQSLAERQKAKEPAEILRSLLLNGRVAMAAGQWGDAERLLKDVLSQASSVPLLCETHGRLAQLYTRVGKISAADDEFRQLLTTAQVARQHIENRELRFAFFTALTELFDSYVDFLIARGRAAEALAVTEMIRAQTLEEGSTVRPTHDVRTIARDRNATILCYWLGSKHSYLWIVTPKHLDAVFLPPKRIIENAIDEYQNDLLGLRGTLERSGERGEALWRMLVGPAERAIAPGSRVIIVPDGRLHAFNMETLVAPRPAPHYWIEDAIVATAGSLKLLMRNAPKRDATLRLLLVGNAPPPSDEFAPLPQAGVEMEKVWLHFNPAQSVMLSGTNATATRYRAASPGAFTYLHFVAHGVATRLKPLDSAVVLAREGDVFKLYARDIAKQSLTARLVTISSCQGAGTRTYAGEGLVGLAWGFLRAGAGNVIAALWDVNDSSTPELMDKMYDGLRAGHDPAVALRDAKLKLIRDHGGPRAFYWAPFVLYSGS